MSTLALPLRACAVIVLPGLPGRSNVDPRSRARFVSMDRCRPVVGKHLVKLWLLVVGVLEDDEA